MERFKQKNSLYVSLSVSNADLLQNFPSLLSLIDSQLQIIFFLFCSLQLSV